jgi:hypothetical protein
MKRLFIMAALVMALIFAGCDQPASDDTGAGDNAPKLTIRNESSYDLANVRWADKSFTSSGQDILKTASSTQAGKDGDSGYIFFILKNIKNIGVELRTAAVVSIPETETFRFLDNTLVVEVANSSNSKALSEFSLIKIGDTGPGGGIVFLVDAKNNGWEVSAKLSGSYDWYNAKIAADSFRGEGFSDWYLPSISELNFIYQNLQKAGIANLGSDTYWSSSENGGGGLGLSFSNGSQGSGSKGYTNSVRAVRAF